MHKIDYARQCALDILQPSKAELERGLELHRQSLVFDSYGFSPVSNFHLDVLKAISEDGAPAPVIGEMSAEHAQTRHVYDPLEFEAYRYAWEQSGVTCMFQNAGEEGQSITKMIRRLARFTYVTDFLREFVAKAVRPEDIESAHAADKHCLYLTTNGVPLLGSLDVVVEELDYIRTFFLFGVRMMHLTYNRRNLIGDGCAEKANAGLSDFGEAVIREMNRVGMIVDTAHTGWQTTLDAAAVSLVPIVASHTACHALCEHFRGKSNEVIKAIAGTGGTIGVCCIPHFLGRSQDIAALLDHVDHLVKVAGVDHVSIGTDFAYQSPNAEPGVDAFKLPKARKPWRTFWRDQPPSPPKDGRKVRSLLWTNWPLFTVGLVQRGYSDDDIAKIIGGNFLRVTKDAWRVSAFAPQVGIGGARPPAASKLTLQR